MIEFTMGVSEDPECLAYLIAKANSYSEIMELILALDENVADLHFTKALVERLEVAIAVEEEN